jgi:lysophospholipase L1-like esterase
LTRSAAAWLAVLALGLVLSEGAFRLYQRLNPSFLFPGQGYQRFRGRPHALEYGFPLNGRGFKDLEFGEKRAGARRIVALGDSFAHGVVPYPQNFLTLLETRLAERGDPVEVLNLGIPGAGVHDYRDLLAAEGFALSPDAVLVCFFLGNDFDPEPPPPDSYVLAFLRSLWNLATQPEGRVLRRPSRYQDDAPTFTAEGYDRILQRRLGLFRVASLVFEERLASACATLDQVRRACVGRGVELRVVLLPDELQADGEVQARLLPTAAGRRQYDFERPGRRLAQCLHAQGVPVLDLLPPFRDEARLRRLYKPRDSHWNIAGNAFAAERIAEWLHP